MQTLGFVCQAWKIIIECVRWTGEQLVLRRRCAVESDVIFHEPLVKNCGVISFYGVPSHIWRGRQGVAIIPGIQVYAETDLAQIVEAIRPLRRRFCARQGWQHQRGENGDDGNDHQ